MVAAGWVLTCDPGVDDAIALAVAAGWPGRPVAAVVAGAGNVDALAAWRNAAGVAALTGLDVTVGLGSAAALAGTAIRRVGSSHGPDGLVGLARRLPPPRTRRPAPGHTLVRGDVIATGPLTDVAIALRSGQRIERVVWLGGDETASGAPARGPEFNASADPEAVNAVVAARTRLSVVPLDLARRVVLGPGALDRWAAGPPAARFCADLLAARHGPAGGVLPDPVAVVAALAPALFRWTPRRVRCATGGRHPRGTLLADGGPSPAVRVAVDVDAAAVHDRIVDAVGALT